MTQAPTPTADTVRRLVRSLLGGSTEPDVRPVAGGVAPDTWWVGTRHVLRLAPDRETAVRGRRELRLRELVRPYLPVALPASVAHGEWAPGLAYTLDAKVAGGSGEDHDVSALGEADLAALLTGLREVPVRQAETLGVPRAAPRSLEALRQSAERAVRRLAAADEFDTARPERLTREAAAQLGVQPGAAVLVHHGLTGGTSWSAPTAGCAASSAGATRSSATRPRTSPGWPSPWVHPPPSARPPSPATAPGPACAACGWPAATR